MSDGLNDCNFIGNLAVDPELRSTSGGESVLKFRIGCTESYQDRNKNRQEKTEWVSVVMWGKRGEALARILHKGDRVFVKASANTSSYDDKDGNKRYKTEFKARDVILCGGGSRGGQQNAPAPATGGGYSDDYYAAKGGDDSDFPFD